MATKATEKPATEKPATKAAATPAHEMTAEEKAKALAAENAKKEKRAKKTALREQLKAAKNTLFQFTQTKEFDALTEDVKEALKRLAPEPRAAGAHVGGGGSSIADIFDKLFPTVGAGIDELALFKETKWGPSEMRKRVRNALKKSKPETRKWIMFDSEKETWTLVGIGPEAPANWK